MRTAVGIVFDTLHLGRDAVFVAAEINLAIVLLVAAALMTHGDAAVDVAARFLELATQQARFRLAFVQAGCNHLDQPAPAWGCGFNFN